MARVVFDRVTKQYDGAVAPAIGDLSLNVEDGEFLVLVGPSGCGKSTALRSLAGLEEITSGDIFIGDRVVTHVPAKDRDIAMVFQSYALYPHMTVEDNMAFGLRLRRTPRQEIAHRVKEAATMLGLADLLDRKPRQLSGGQRQRVALGRAIVREPRVYLLDEPLSNLDAKLRVQTRTEIIKLQRRLGTTTIYVTHDQVEAMTMGHRIAVMNHGTLQQLDTPEQLYDHPANLFVATFIGSPAMNVFPAQLVRKDGLRLVAEGLELQVTSERASRLEGHVGRDVLVGVRPEHLGIPNAGNPAGAGCSIRLPLDLVEPLGSDTLLYLRGPRDMPIVARVEPHLDVRPGDVLELAVNTDYLHVFDAQTEEALT